MELKEQFQKLVSEMQRNIKDQEDLRYLQENIIGMMADILDKVENLCNSNQIKIAKLEEKVDKMAKELYVNDMYDINIVCPYCNYEFETEFDEEKTEIKCPECKNIIELDWSSESEGDGCPGSCGSCGGCGSELPYEDNEDDM